MSSHHILLTPTATVRGLTRIALLLILASVGGQLAIHLAGYEDSYRIVRLVNLDAERNIPALFSTLLLLCAALLLAFITILKKNLKATYVTHWGFLACGFLFMTADEAFSFHEMLVPPMRKLLGDGHLGIFYFAWVLPGICLVAVLALSFLRFLWHLPARTRLIFVLAATLYLGGSIGFELIGGHYAESSGTKNLTYNMLATVEESLEMAGAITFIGELMQFLAAHHLDVRFRPD